MKVKNSAAKRYLGGWICPTLRANKTSSGVIEVMADVKVIGSFEEKFESRNRIYDVDECSPTLSKMQDTSNYLTSVQKDNLLLEKPSLLGGIGKENEFGSQYRQGNRVYSSDACAMALNSQPVGNAGGNSYLYIVGYRIRKLTPRECGRLMGVSDEDISKMAAVNSNTQLYKQFGNSIVVDVMCAMFKNLNINQGDTV